MCLMRPDQARINCLKPAQLNRHALILPCIKKSRPSEPRLRAQPPAVLRRRCRSRGVANKPPHPTDLRELRAGAVSSAMSDAAPRRLRLLMLSLDRTVRSRPWCGFEPIVGLRARG